MIGDYELLLFENFLLDVKLLSKLLINMNLVYVSLKVLYSLFPRILAVNFLHIKVISFSF
jgi:hypothetical protein